MNDDEMTTLMNRAGSELLPDVPDLVVRGQARGRTRLRRRRAGAAIVAAAVVGVAGAALVAAQPGPGAAPTTVLDPAGGPSGKAEPTETSSPRDEGQPAPDAPLALDPDGIRDQLASMLPGEVGPILRDHPYPVVTTEHDRILHFLYQGTVTSFIIEPARGMASCEQQAGAGCTVVDGVEILTWGPTTADRVTSQGVSVWKHGYIVSVLSYNGAEGKDVAPVMPEPPISLATLTDIAMSDVWYS